MSNNLILGCLVILIVFYADEIARALLGVMK